MGQFWPFYCREDDKELGRYNECRIWRLVKKRQLVCFRQVRIYRVDLFAIFITQSHGRCSCSCHRHYESLLHENPLKMRWKTRDETVFNGHENRDHGVYIRSMKFLSSFKGVVFMGHEKFTKHWKLISWATKLLSISDWKNSWPMKVQRPPSIYFMGHENYNWPWDSHVSNSWSRSQFPVLSHSVIPNYRCLDFA